MTKYLDSTAVHLEKSGEYRAALKLYQKARQLEPDNPYVLFDMSGSYANTDKLEMALALLDTAIMINDTISAFYNNRGLLHYKLIQNIDAIADYNHAILLEPGNAVFYNNLALVYFYENEPGQACELFSKARLMGEPASEIEKEKRAIGLVCHDDK